MDTSFFNGWTKEDAYNNNGKKLLKMYPKYSKKVFDNIVTGDETWLYYFEPKRKVANRVWATKNARRKSIAKRIRTVKKVMYATFYSKGSSYSNPSAKSRAVTGKFYTNAVLRKLKNYYKSRCPKQNFKIFY